MRRSTASRGTAMGAGYRGRKKEAPHRRGLFHCLMRRLPLRGIALDFDFHTTVRRETGDQFLAVLLITRDARNRLRLAHADGFDAITRHTLLDQVVAHGV